MKELFKDKLFIRDLIIAFIIALIIIQFVRPTIVRGQSMEPTLQNNNYLFLSMQAYRNHDPEYGDIIVAQSDVLDEKIIKRVIGVPGDAIKIENNIVYRNGQPIVEDYIMEQGNVPGTVDVFVGDDEIFVMGDNRANSTDSRVLGCISMDDVLGKAVYRLFPLKDKGKL